MDLAMKRGPYLKKRKQKKRNSSFVRLSEVLSVALSSHLSGGVGY